MATCMFCSNDKFLNTPYENTIFNNKEFTYLRCTNCQLVFVSPLPTNDDFEKMYSLDYQGEINTASTGAYDALIAEIKKQAHGNKVLDYGCGGGRFIKELKPEEFQIHGAEFSPQLVEVLKKKYPHAKFQTIEATLASDETFDIIFMSNVLEHLTNPVEIVNILKTKLTAKGILVAEGPLEEQFTFAYLVRKLFFGFKKNVLKRKAHHPPYHLTRTNYANQLSFFTSAGFKPLHYRCFEYHWPFPASAAECASLNKKLQYNIARFSIWLGKNKERWGNGFTFIGRV